MEVEAATSFCKQEMSQPVVYIIVYNVQSITI